MLFIRTDASAQIGTGHVMRCIALAQAWRQLAPADSDIVFVCAQVPEPLVQRLVEQKFRVITVSAKAGSMEDVEETLQSIEECRGPGSDWFATDGYSFGADYQKSLRRAGFKLLVIDDYNHLDLYDCDILLNQNSGAEQYTYNINIGARKLLGPHYALLRNEFVETGDNPRKTGREARRLLITLGGADPDNITALVLRCLAKHKFLGLETRVVVGGGNRHRADVERLVNEIAADNVELLVDVQDMTAQMAWADLAITAGGSTCWELCRFGVPMLILVLAENQAALAGSLHEKHIAINLGWGIELTTEQLVSSIQSLQETQDRLVEMSTLATELVDGKGARIAASIMKCMVAS